MSSFCLSGKINMLPDENDSSEDIYEGGYPFKIPEVYIEGSAESYYPQVNFSWSDDSIVLKRDNTITRFTIHDYFELYAEDENGDKIWVDGRNAPYEDCWKGHYLDSTRNAKSISTTIYNLKNLTKQVIEFKVDVDKTEPMTDYEIGEFGDVSNEKVCENIDNIIETIKQDNSKYLELDEKLKNDLEFNEKLLEKSYRYDFLQYVPSSIIENEEFIKFSLPKYYGAFKYFSEKVRDDYNLVLSLLKKPDTTILLNYASDRLKDDFDIVLSAVKAHGDSIEFASSRLKMNEDIIHTALISNYRSYHYLPEEIRSKREYALFALKYCGYPINGFLRDLPDNLKNDKEILISALKHGDNLYDVNDELLLDRDVLIACIESSNYGFSKNVPLKFQNDEEIVRMLINNDPKYISKVTDEDLKRKLLDEDPYLSLFINKNNGLNIESLF